MNAKVPRHDGVVDLDLAAGPVNTTTPVLRMTMSSATSKRELGVLLDQHDRQPAAP